MTTPKEPAKPEAVVKAVEEVKQAAETTKEVAKEATAVTVEGLEDTANHALEFLGVPIDVHTLIHDGVELGINILLALLIFFVGKWVGKRILAVINRMLERSRLDQTVVNFLNNLLYGLMIVTVL